MYVELRISEALHKKSCRIGPGLGGISEEGGKAKFAESLFYEVG
jgi:hypothetical protein